MDIYNNSTFTIKSQPKGLWIRMFAKLVSYWIGGIFLLSAAIISTINIDSRESATLVVSAFVIMLVVVAFKVLSDTPKKWDNEVTFNLESRSLLIKNKETDTTISFDEINELIPKVDDSLFFSTYYFFSIECKSKNISLLATKDASEYSALLDVIRKKTNIKIQP